MFPFRFTLLLCSSLYVSQACSDWSMYGFGDRFPFPDPGFPGTGRFVQPYPGNIYGAYPSSPYSAYDTVLGNDNPWRDSQWESAWPMAGNGLGGYEADRGAPWQPMDVPQPTGQWGSTLDHRASPSHRNMTDSWQEPVFDRHDQADFAPGQYDRPERQRSSSPGRRSGGPAQMAKRSHHFAESLQADPGQKYVTPEILESLEMESPETRRSPQLDNPFAMAYRRGEPVDGAHHYEARNDYRQLADTLYDEERLLNGGVLPAVPIPDAALGGLSPLNYAEPLPRVLTNPGFGGYNLYDPFNLGPYSDVYR